MDWVSLVLVAVMALIAGLMAFGVVHALIQGQKESAEKEAARQRENKGRRSSENKVPEAAKDSELPMLLFKLGLFGLAQLIAGLFVLTLMYGVVVIIFRYAFGVELWNPFR